MIAITSAVLMLESIDSATADRIDANCDSVITELYESFPDEHELINEMKTYTNAYASLIVTIMTMDCMMADYARVKLMKLLTGFRENIMFIASRLDGIDAPPPQFSSDEELMASLGTYVPNSDN